MKASEEVEMVQTGGCDVTASYLIIQMHEYLHNE